MLRALTTLRRRRVIAAILLSVTTAVVLWPGSPVAYLARQGYYQARLLYGRVPNEVAIRDGLVVGVRAERLRRIAEIRAFGEEVIGLTPTDNYTTVNPDFDRLVWNVSASLPDRFEPRQWWFPVVGRVPYLGYFEEEDARDQERRLARQGLDVRVRTAGAYSSLGWFRDPVTPRMLEWPTGELANTVLHELVHATLFVPGQVEWNESFANFVGDVAEERYLAARGRDLPPDEVKRSRDHAVDSALLADFLDRVYGELDRLYSSGAPRESVLSDKARVLAAARERFRGIPFASPRMQGWLDRNPLNNATLLNWRRYNRGQAEFRELLERAGGDVRYFMERMRRIEKVLAERGGDPFQLMGSLIPADTT